MRAHVKHETAITGVRARKTEPPRFAPARFGAYRQQLLVMQRTAGNQHVLRLLESMAVGQQSAAAGLPTAATDVSQAHRRQVAQRGKTGPVDTTVVIPSLDATRATGRHPSVRVHDNPASHRAAVELGAYGYSWQGDIFLGPGLSGSSNPSRDDVVRHELVHAHQARRVGPYQTPATLEAEAQAGRLHDVRWAADPNQVLGWWWVVPVVAGVYALLRPKVANAPGPEDATQKSPSDLQIAGEAIAMFGVPAGVARTLVGWGFRIVGTSALAGGTSAVAFRGVQDVGAGEFSGLQAYVVDATSGAVLGAVIGGTIRWFTPGAAGGESQSLVHLTTPTRAASIRGQGVLKGTKGIWAADEGILAQGPRIRTLRTTGAPTEVPIPIPPAASGHFQPVLPLGPMSLYQRAAGVYRAPGGTISLETGVWRAGSRLSSLSGYVFPYSVDVAFWTALAAEPTPDAYQRGWLPALYGPIADFLRSQPQDSPTSRSDGPFIFLEQDQQRGPDGAGAAVGPAKPATVPQVIFVTPNNQQGG